MIFAVSGTFRWNHKNLWQLKTTHEYFINLKVMVVLKTINQSLSISDLLTLLSWCLNRWNFTWKQPSWYFFRNGNLTDWSGLHKSYVNAVYFSNIYNQGELMCKSLMFNVMTGCWNAHHQLLMHCGKCISLPLKMQMILSAFNVLNFTHRVFYSKNSLGNILI